MPTVPLIAYANVSKSFDGGAGFERIVALDDVSLDVAEGEFLAIVGSSGSGKTTLLRLANRLIEAETGSITIEGEDVRTVDPVGLRRRIGYVFQSGGLFPHLTVAGNIGITPKLLGMGVVMITHDMTEALLLADRIAVMRAGRLMAVGTPAELSNSSDSYVVELLRTPRRQAERLHMLLPRDTAT